MARANPPHSGRRSGAAPLVNPDGCGYSDAMRAALLSLLVVMTPTAAAAARPAKGERVDVVEVITTEDGQHAVLLRTQGKGPRLLPIWVGDVEALAIRLRLDRRQPPRPLTLDLLESVIESGNIKVLEVRVDGLRRGVFLGKVKLKLGARTWEVEARPSDAIGVALGQGAAIWVAQEVLDQAALDLGELERVVPRAPVDGAPAAPRQPVSSPDETL